MTKIIYINSGSCNGCDIELLVAFTLYLKDLKFEIEHEVKEDKIEILILTGPITRQMYYKISKMFKKVKYIDKIIAIGSCACGGGIWYDTYATIGGIDNLLGKLKQDGIEIKVNEIIYTPGCPAKPDQIAKAIEQAIKQ